MSQTGERRPESRVLIHRKHWGLGHMVLSPNWKMLLIEGQRGSMVQVCLYWVKDLPLSLPAGRTPCQTSLGITAMSLVLTSSNTGFSSNVWCWRISS